MIQFGRRCRIARTRGSGVGIRPASTRHSRAALGSAWRRSCGEIGFGTRRLDCNAMVCNPSALPRLLVVPPLLPSPLFHSSPYRSFDAAHPIPTCALTYAFPPRLGYPCTSLPIAPPHDLPPAPYLHVPFHPAPRSISSLHSSPYRSFTLLYSVPLLPPFPHHPAPSTFLLLTKS
jgi:hypothetical protein